MTWEPGSWSCRALARAVGVVASDPEHYDDGVTADAADKMARFVETCDEFHLPVVNFVDVPGFVIGPAAERRHDPARRPGPEARAVEP